MLNYTIYLSRSVPPIWKDMCVLPAPWLSLVPLLGTLQSVHLQTPVGRQFFSLFGT